MLCFLRTYEEVVVYVSRHFHKSKGPDQTAKINMMIWTFKGIILGSHFEILPTGTVFSECPPPSLFIIFSIPVTLKIRSGSPKSNQFFV